MELSVPQHPDRHLVGHQVVDHQAHVSAQQREQLLHLGHLHGHEAGEMRVQDANAHQQVGVPAAAAPKLLQQCLPGLRARRPSRLLRQGPDFARQLPLGLVEIALRIASQLEALPGQDVDEIARARPFGVGERLLSAPYLQQQGDSVLI